ncbi:MAG: hypothetical protein U1E76_27230 [Planctomycetota bacterium]
MATAGSTDERSSAKEIRQRLGEEAVRIAQLAFESRNCPTRRLEHVHEDGIGEPCEIAAGVTAADDGFDAAQAEARRFTAPGRELLRMPFDPVKDRRDRVVRAAAGKGRDDVKTASPGWLGAQLLDQMTSAGVAGDDIWWRAVRAIEEHPRHQAHDFQ